MAHPAGKRVLIGRPNDFVVRHDLHRYGATLELFSVKKFVMNLFRMFLRGALFWLSSTRGRRNGRAGGRQEKNGKPRGSAAPEQQMIKTAQKLPVHKRNFRPLETNGRADENQKMLPLESSCPCMSVLDRPISGFCMVLAIPSSKTINTDKRL